MRKLKSSEITESRKITQPAALGPAKLVIYWNSPKSSFLVPFFTFVSLVSYLGLEYRLRF